MATKKTATTKKAAKKKTKKQAAKKTTKKTTKKMASSSKAAASSRSLYQRLLIKEQTLHVVDPPHGFELTVPVGSGMGFALPARLGADDALLAFVKNKAAVDALARKLKTALDDDVETLLWLAYPKGTGSIATDISRDHGWEAMRALGYHGVAIVAVDDDWSAVRLRHRSRSARRG
jgi:hypothetical protein